MPLSSTRFRCLQSQQTHNTHLVSYLVSDLQGPYQMLFSRKSPLFAPGLTIFYRILYMSPCYIYIVSALASPTFMVIPVIFIWFGKFPAVLTHAVLGMLIAYTALSSFIKFYVRPGRNILHDLRSCSISKTRLSSSNCTLQALCTAL